MIFEILEIIFLLFTTLMIAYLVRHYIFTISVLRSANRSKDDTNAQTNSGFEPTVSILIPPATKKRS